ncbi:MAG: helix-turn-helix transcriptional regulator [Alphaproteobacteria bacterium]|nr:helix-turn-helix transcriptional regulator [Alphaproteobacteria bacterium]
MSSGYLHTAENKELCRRLKSARKKAGLTQAELASRLGKLQSYVTKYEREERRIDVTELILITTAIGVDPVQFFSEFTKFIARKRS